MLAKKVVLSLCLCPAGSLSFSLTAFSPSHTAVSDSVGSAAQNEDLALPCLYSGLL